MYECVSVHASVFDIHMATLRMCEGLNFRMREELNFRMCEELHVPKSSTHGGACLCVCFID